MLAQGKTPINGPHQGAWVETVTGEQWFMHFQDKGAYGRVHLQPMRWIADRPVTGTDPDGDGTGEPVLTYKKPNVGRGWPIVSPPDWMSLQETDWVYSGNGTPTHSRTGPFPRVVWVF